MSKPNYVVITRSEEKSKPFIEALHGLGLQTINYPTTKQVKALSSSEFEEYLSLLPSYDWLIFTSSNGVRFFVEAMEEIGQTVKNLPQIRVATVGEKTAQIAKQHGFNVNFTPSTFTIQALTEEMPEVKNKKILIPRSALGNPDLETELEKKGAMVTDMPLYTTITQKINLDKFWSLHTANQILCLTFTSPSSVAGFIENVGSKLSPLLSLPVCSIGPATTAALTNYKFNHIYTASPHTTEGMITKIKQSVL